MVLSVSREWVNKHLVCEFDHWDTCISGLINVDGKMYLCHLTSDDTYDIIDIQWDEKCEEYLEDYRVAYKHWFYLNGKRPWSYGGWSVSWFHEKWGNRSPIEENSNVI